MLKIVPKVKSITENDFKINFNDINLQGKLSEFAKNDLQSFINDKTEYCCKENGYVIDFRLLENNHNAEWYSIEAKETEMIISACTEEGIFRAIQTLKQILSQPICGFIIEDEPENPFRGFMLDVGRYYYSVSDIKTIIDYATLYKFNYFHWHLTEDQGWRFESKKYPKLTEIGSKRSHTNFGIKKESGFYTQNEMREIVKYCHDRFIKVIPEIDMPGHTMSALACYKELSCFDRKLKVATHWGVKFDIMCAGKDFTYTFCKEILDELCEVFPDEYIHIGGDEAPKKRWELCENCNNKMKELGLDNMEQLQLYFANYLAEYLETKGRQTIMWYNKFDEKDKIVPNKDIILQFWGQKKDTEFAEIVKNGRKVITSNSSAYYIDLPYGYITLNDSYNTQGVTGIEDTKTIFGYETCLWTEYVKNLKKAKFNMFPRVFAISEIFWSGEKDKNYAKFLETLEFEKQFIKEFNVKVPRKGIYNPNPIRKFFSKLWFEKRQLVWQGLYLNIDNFLLKRKVDRSKK